MLLTGLNGVPSLCISGMLGPLLNKVQLFQLVPLAGTGLDDRESPAACFRAQKNLLIKAEGAYLQTQHINSNERQSQNG